MKQKRNSEEELEFIDLDEEEEYDVSDDDEEEEYDFSDDDDDYDDDFDEELDENALRFVKRVLFPAVIGIVVVIVAVALFFLFRNGTEEKTSVMNETSEAEDFSQGQENGPERDVEPDSEENAQSDKDAAGESAEKPVGETAQEKPEDDAEADMQKDPETETMSTEQGTEVDVSKLLTSGAATETEEITFGIDVARYQGTIDWAQVADSGVDFVMVRVGYRMDGSREIVADSNARYNMQEAQKNGIKVGAYFFSTATTTDEAIEEAGWVADFIAKYQITYPVAYDCEGFDQPDSVQYGLTNAQRTDIAIAFLQEIYNRGYTPMFYSSMGELTGSAKWDTERLEGSYRIWVSQYPATPYPQTAKSSYTGTHAMWQYTNRGTVDGISKPVDVNVAYFGYEGTAQAQNTEAPEEVTADAEALMNFTQVSENVTAKDSTNLRNIPSQGEDSTIVYTLKNGETIARTGVSDSGWSRLELNGQTVYAVSSYLTTDLSYQAPAAPSEEGAGSGDGLKTKFTERNDQVTAKIEVNLRTLPSVTNPDATVVATLHNGEYVTRTGINEEYGWSRVEYNGQTLYCISSYLMN